MQDTIAREVSELLEAPAKRPTRKRKAPPKTIAPVPQQEGGNATRYAALAGVALTSLMSAALNGYCYSTHAPSPLAGWALGISVPILILILGRVAGGTKGTKRWASALSGASLLLLSVSHCAESISAITGSSLALAIPLAIAIDCGLVSCELALLDD
jgi:hypothetical protein